MKVANLRGAASLVDSTCQYPRVFVGIGEFLIHATKKKMQNSNIGWLLSYFTDKCDVFKWYLGLRDWLITS